MVHRESIRPCEVGTEYIQVHTCLPCFLHSSHTLLNSSVIEASQSHCFLPGDGAKSATWYLALPTGAECSLGPSRDFFPGLFMRHQGYPHVNSLSPFSDYVLQINTYST